MPATMTAPQRAYLDRILDLTAGSSFGRLIAAEVVGPLLVITTEYAPTPVTRYCDVIAPNGDKLLTVEKDGHGNLAIERG